MKGSSHWVHKQGKRPKAIAYGAYLPDDNPNPLDIERDGERVEKEAERERRRESAKVLRAVKEASKGMNPVGYWVPTEERKRKG